MTPTKKAAATKKADDEPKDRKDPSPEREAEIDAGLRTWSAADRARIAIETGLADETLLPRDRMRLQGDLAEAHATMAEARARIVGTA